MKNFLKFIFFLGAIITIILYRNEITEIIIEVLDPPKTFNVSMNKHSLDYDFMFVKNFNNKDPENKEDIINIFYSVINSGNLEANFTCPTEYTNCIDDVVEISNSETLLASINDYVHPFYTYKTIKTTIINNRNIKIVIEHTYSDDVIAKIDETTDELLVSLVNDSMSNYEKVKVLHDYIINNTKYDEERASNNTSDYDSSTAYGPLYQGYALCSGYSDLMGIYLNKLNIPNYRIATENHIWNFVYVDDKWLHLDLTWDDPISKNKDVLLDHYFLIDTNKLFELDSSEHNFNMNVYLEAKN